MVKVSVLVVNIITMNKTVIAMAISTLCLMSVAQAAPKDNTWYLGGKMGWSNYQKGGVSDTLTNYDTDNDGVGVGVYGGYQLNSWLGFEGGYDYLDKMAYTSTLGDNDFKSQGVQLSAKVSYAFNPVVDLIGRVGGFAYESDNNDESVSGVSPLLAIGTEYAPNREWGARLEYQWISQIGDEEDAASGVGHFNGSRRTFLDHVAVLGQRASRGDHQGDLDLGMRCGEQGGASQTQGGDDGVHAERNAHEDFLNLERCSKSAIAAIAVRAKKLRLIEWSTKATGYAGAGAGFRFLLCRA